MDVVVKGIGALQRKSNYQAGMVEAFKGLLNEGGHKGKGNVEEVCYYQRDMICNN
jgi:hypothetical protein